MLEAIKQEEDLVGQDLRVGGVVKALQHSGEELLVVILAMRCLKTTEGIIVRLWTSRVTGS